MRKPTIGQRLGHTPLDETIGKPAIDLTADLLTIARTITENLPSQTIFRREDRYFTIEQSRRKNTQGIYPCALREMTASRLRTWLCTYLSFAKGSGDNARSVQLPASIADAIMASDPWWSTMDELETVIPVRLPIWGPTTADGTRTIQLAPIGYHAPTMSYITETLDYTTGSRQYSPRACRAAWDQLMHTFPWGPESDQENKICWKLPDGTIKTGPQPTRNRSACCCMALMLGQYCRLLIDDVMPIGLFNANQPGSGKSLLAWLCLTPTWGMAAGAPDCKNEDDAIKALQAALISRRPFYVLDDVPVLASGTINMIATTNEVEGRKLGGLDMFSTRNKMQIFATGNNIGTTADVERRALICDLFLATAATKRKFASPLNKKSLATPTWRADLLRLMHSMVRNWADAGCPELVPPDAKPTFETYATIVGSIMVHNGFGNPFTERRYSGAGGDLIGRTIQRLLAYIAANLIPAESSSETFKLAKIVEIADANDWLQTITGGKSPLHSMGKRLEGLRGQKLYDENGRPFEFGKRETAGQSAYTFTILKS